MVWPHLTWIPIAGYSFNTFVVIRQCGPDNRWSSKWYSPFHRELRTAENAQKNTAGLMCSISTTFHLHWALLRGNHIFLKEVCFFLLKAEHSYHIFIHLFFDLPPAGLSIHPPIYPLSQPLIHPPICFICPCIIHIHSFTYLTIHASICACVFVCACPWELTHTCAVHTHMQIQPIIYPPTHSPIQLAHPHNPSIHSVPEYLLYIQSPGPFCTNS